MILKDAISCKGPVVPDFLKDKIQMVSNCEIDQKIILYFTSGLFLISDELEEDGYSKDNLSSVVIIFSKDGNCSLIQDDPDTMGCHCSIIIYNISKMYKNINLTLFTFVEELVHHFWRISNETDAKMKTLKILQRADPSFTIDIIKGWGVNWK